jgi:hypothetical protein
MIIAREDVLYVGGQDGSNMLPQHLKDIRESLTAMARLPTLSVRTSYYGSKVL